LVFVAIEYNRTMTEETGVVFITGAGKGLGRRMALAFGARGFGVAITGIEGTHETCAELRAQGTHALDIHLDLTRPEQIEEGVARALNEFGSIDVLINNAAVEGPTAPVTQVSLRDWETTLAVNLTGAFLCDRALIPHMMARRSGCIIHISSVAGTHAYPMRAPYAVSKWALIGLTQTLAAELGPYNLRVNAVCPGPVQGDRMGRVIAERARAQGRSPGEIEEEYRARSVLHRMVEPEDVVSLVLFLASDAARNITGQAIPVCGGYGL
jgi:NAD(P)-dependent dehydrogenase (short-subunit alcohol dehydrogenase family)